MPSRELTVTFKIDKLVPGGQALGTLPDGKKAFLWGALPGETVTRLTCTKAKSHYIEGIALDIENPSSTRITPQDECYLSTSPWQIMDYTYELAQKSEILHEVFRQHHIDLDEVNLDSVQTDNHDFYYRNKMEYALYYDHDDQQIHPAFHQRGSHRKIPVSHSSLERPEIWQQAQTIIAELNRTGADARRYQSLLLRCNQNGEVSGGLYENHQPRAQFDCLRDQILGTTYTYSPNGFFQINLPVYSLALAQIQHWIKGDRVLDLYAGVGSIGLSVASGHDLVLVECDRSAYRELETNVRALQQTSSQHSHSHIQPIFAKSEAALDYIAPDQTVILDPPRAGCHPTLIEKLHTVLPRQIIYLSCNPVTQARDVAQLLDCYQIQQITPYNFFPRTPHLENLIILEAKA